MKNTENLKPSLVIPHLTDDERIWIKWPPVYDAVPLYSTLRTNLTILTLFRYHLCHSKGSWFLKLKLDFAIWEIILILYFSQTEIRKDFRKHWRVSTEIYESMTHLCELQGYLQSNRKLFCKPLTINYFFQNINRNSVKIVRFVRRVLYKGTA
jgi:hypothetical protein